MAAFTALYETDRGDARRNLKRSYLSFRQLLLSLLPVLCLPCLSLEHHTRLLVYGITSDKYTAGICTGQTRAHDEGGKLSVASDKSRLLPRGSNPYV